MHSVQGLHSHYMNLNTAIIVDSIEAHRKATARILRHAGWTTYTTSNDVHCPYFSEEFLASIPDGHGLILIGLGAPKLNAKGDDFLEAPLILHLRHNIDKGNLPKIPIVALISSKASGYALTAQAYGCDAVLETPLTVDLPYRLQTVLHSSFGTARQQQMEFVAILRAKLVDTYHKSAIDSEQLTIADLNTALLAYQRRGAVGLGESKLALSVVPHTPDVIKRGEELAKLLHNHLFSLVQQGDIAARILLTELSTPDICVEELFAISKSTYYRHRHRVCMSLLEFLKQTSFSLQSVSSA